MYWWDTEKGTFCQHTKRLNVTIWLHLVLAGILIFPRSQHYTHTRLEHLTRKALGVLDKFHKINCPDALVQQCLTYAHYGFHHRSQSPWMWQKSRRLPVILCSPVNAFMNVDNERLSILKKGSRTGYFWEPQSTVCSRMWGTPVLSIGVVRNWTLQGEREKKS